MNVVFNYHRVVLSDFLVCYCVPNNIHSTLHIIKVNDGNSPDQILFVVGLVNIESS